MRNIAIFVLMDAVAVAQNSTEYSDYVVFEKTTGEAGMLVVSTGGSITISQQCSYDKKTWYDPVDAAGNKMGEIATGMLSTTGAWITVTPVMAPYSRYKVTENNSGNTSVTLRLFFQEQT